MLNRNGSSFYHEWIQPCDGEISTYPFKVFGGQWGKAHLNVVNKGDTVVGNDVWLGNSATIMQDVKIGDGAIIGAHSLVTQSVEPYTVVAGNPARLIRKRIDTQTIDFLLKLKWWDCDIKKITNYLEFIVSANINELKKIYEIEG